MTILKKVPRPERRIERTIRAPAGNAEILGLRHVPGGGWHHTILDGKPVAVTYCPKCGLEAYLDDHSIDTDGIVTPSVICPHAPCTFHDDVRLENWEP